jgi:hypothetical protein
VKEFTFTKQFDPNPNNNLKAHPKHANAKGGHQMLGGLNNKSFMQHLAELNLAVDQDIKNSELDQEALDNTFDEESFAGKKTKAQTKENAKTKKATQTQAKATTVSEEEFKGQDKLNAERRQVAQEKSRTQNQEQARRTTSESTAKTHANEAALAHAAQAHDAVKEGNVAEQNYEADPDKQRKEQLQNWEDLSTKIVEDVVNKAVRIDIPGLSDISTVIVRMNGSSVQIQTIGSGEVANMLMNKESQLKAALSKRNVRMHSLQSFDAKSVSV